MTITPLYINGPARLVDVKARGEGPEDEKVLASDLKFTMTTKNDLLIAFHPQLRLMLFNNDGMPRFPMMGPIEWDYTFNDMLVSINPKSADPVLHFEKVSLRKWVFEPKRGGMIDVIFHARIHPDQHEFGIVGGVIVTGAVELLVRGANGDLFDNVPESKGEAGEQKVPDLEGGEPDGAAPPAETPPEAPPETPPEPEAEPAPEPPAEVTDGLLNFLRVAGRAEAAKPADDRDTDVGFGIACNAAGLKRDFIEENLAQLQGAFMDGFEEALGEEPETGN